MVKALMITGTNSSAGKSFLVTALCRYFAKKGFKVAPFKAQNMSLQSFVCKDGSEIGLAQALQAMACGIEPEKYFNPILLKPEGNQKSQVLLLGKVYKTLSAEDYYKEREILWATVKEVLDYLKDKYDLLILEGAGSPAEINLLEVDIVNIKPALYLNCPVFLVGDIDKGGVFASLYGTLELLKKFKPDYAKLIKGYIINKFRGSEKILYPGINSLNELTGLPFLGILPYKEDLKISDEDGYSFFTKRKNRDFTKGEVKIVILPLPRISNFSDFDPFYIEEDAEVVYSFREEDILSADIIILPGSKSTLSDLLFLKERGIKKLLEKALQRGAEIIGICGGYQMLGKVLKNPYKSEGEIKEMEGLGFLDIETLFYPEKITTQVLARPLSTENKKNTLWGFEIHKGISYGDINLFEIERLATGEKLSEGSQSGKIWGTYLHGIFTNDKFRRELLNRHRIKKGLSPLPVKIRYWDALKENFEKLSQFVENYLDMEKINEISGF
ncbi:MAG: cobyric acid synthase [Caldimicrobium sp.]